MQMMTTPSGNEGASEGWEWLGCGAGLADVNALMTDALGGIM